MSIDPTMPYVFKALVPRQHEHTHRPISGASLCASVAVLEADTSGESCHESSPTMEESVAGRPERPQSMSGGRSPLSDHDFLDDPQQPRNRISSAPVEGSSPTADLGTAEAGDSNYDGAPWCSYGHRTKATCDCRPSADSE